MSSRTGVEALHPLAAIRSAQTLVTHLLNNGIEETKPSTKYYRGKFYFTLSAIQAHLEQAVVSANALFPFNIDDNVSIEYVFFSHNGSNHVNSVTILILLRKTVVRKQSVT
jgi:hypothetical protein